MKKRLIGLALAGAVAGLPAAAPAGASSAEPVVAVAAKACSSGWTHAVINGSHKCLRRGQFCARSARRQYRRYGFRCNSRDARGNWHLTSSRVASLDARLRAASSVASVAALGAHPQARRLKQAGDAGAIAVHPTGDGTMTATYTSNGGRCTVVGYCGWFPYAVQVGPGAACRPHVDDSGDLTYVGELQDEPFPAQVGTAPFVPAGGTGTVCLYVSHGRDGEVLVAQAPFSSGTGWGTQPPASEVEAESVSGHTVEPEPMFLSSGEARRTVREVIRDETRRAPRALRYGCRRQDDVTFACASSWYDAKWIYAGTFDLTEEVDVYTWAFDGVRASRRCVSRYRSARTAAKRCARSVRW